MLHLVIAAGSGGLLIVIARADTGLESTRDLSRKRLGEIWIAVLRCIVVSPTMASVSRDWLEAESQHPLVNVVSVVPPD